MPEATKEAVSRDTTELRVMITEDSHGNIQAEWAAYIKGSEVAIPMRPSHVVGQLVSAAWLINTNSFVGLKDRVEALSSEVNKIQGKKKSERRK